MKNKRDPHDIPINDLVRNYLYGGSEATREKWLKVAQARPDYQQFQQRIERVLS